jgi:hypothetical protein
MVVYMNIRWTHVVVGRVAVVVVVVMQHLRHCPAPHNLGYSEFHNLMRFTRKNLPNILKNVSYKSSSKKYSYMYEYSTTPQKFFFHMSVKIANFSNFLNSFEISAKF